MRAIVLAVFAMFFSIDAVAAMTEITMVRLDAAVPQYASLRTDLAVDLTGHPCAVQQKNFSWDKTTDHGKQMFSLALSAFMSGRRLRIIYSDTDCGLDGTQALITGIYLLRD